MSGVMVDGEEQSYGLPLSCTHSGSPTTESRSAKKNKDGK